MIRIENRARHFEFARRPLHERKSCVTLKYRAMGPSPAQGAVMQIYATQFLKLLVQVESDHQRPLGDDFGDYELSDLFFE